MVSCGHSEEDKARVKLEFGRSLLAGRDTSGALIHLDSIAVLYPKAVYSVNAAKNLINEIRFEFLHQKESELDSLNSQIAEFEEPFEKEKTEFDRYTQYIHKRQTLQRAWNRSYIQVHLDERGELYISSNYFGKDWLNHVGLRVYDKGDDAKTDTISLADPNNHRSDFMELRWEKVSYRNGKDNGVIEFVAQNAGRQLKAVFLGNQNYYIILETYDKQAVIDALTLSNAIKRRSVLETEIKDIRAKLGIS
ncbi:MAG: hypothetical protein LBV47_01660 [Bacteroidales bacterium]|nr:hypothetical protein [Bacteroidales bacterium]